MARTTDDTAAPRESVREAREIAFWSGADVPPGPESLDFFLHKMGEARVFSESLRTHRALFEQATTVVDLGAGQGWTSCLVERSFPGGGRLVVTSDIAAAAVARTPAWERVFDATVGGKLACRSHQLPLADGSVDLVFAFAAAHHFSSVPRTLAEIARVLRRGGHALFLYEPTCRAFIYPLARRRVNRVRSAVAEDVLRPGRVAAAARAAGLACVLTYNRSTAYRRGPETLYYLAMRAVPPLARLLPCTADFVFTKE